MFQGTHTALVTPFRDQAIDAPAFARLIEAQIAAGVDGIVPVGTTGESPTVDHDEHIRIIRLAVEAARGRCKVIAGAGSNSTAEAVEMTREAQDAGADAALIVAPYYNRPSQEGLYRHFKLIADSTKLPIVLYSIPSRCGVEIGIETVRRLAADCPNVVAIKEAGGSVDRVSQLRAALPGAFEILSGDDALTLPFLAAGAVGVISVASNLIPGAVVDLVRAFSLGKNDVARGLHERWYPLFKDLFIEPNPVPVKTALAWCEGYMTADVRLPLCEMADAAAAQAARHVASLGPLEERVSALAIFLQGATGRMGQAVLSCAAREPARFAVRFSGDRLLELAGCEVAIEFSSAAGLAPLLAAGRSQKVPLVIGATGHDDAQRAMIAEAAAEIAIVFAANFRVGVNTLFWLTRKAAEALGPDFDLEVIETHHRLKKDAPSGTARRLVEILAEVRQLSYEKVTRHGRSGMVGERSADEIGLHAVRGGDVVGEHTVLFAGLGERVELTHRASTRETFAVGALRAAEWLRGRAPGLYDMEDVLGLRER